MTNLPISVPAESRPALKELRRALDCLYIAVDKSIADDLVTKANAAIDEFEKELSASSSPNDHFAKRQLADKNEAESTRVPAKSWPSETQWQNEIYRQIHLWSIEQNRKGIRWSDDEVIAFVKWHDEFEATSSVPLLNVPANSRCEVHYHLMPDGRCSCPHTCNHCGTKYEGHNHSIEQCRDILASSSPLPVPRQLEDVIILEPDFRSEFGQTRNHHLNIDGITIFRGLEANCQWIKEHIEKAFARARLPVGESPVPLFEKGQSVRVDHPRFHGFGIVQYDTGEPRKRYVGVLLENGNTWQYEVETVRLSELPEHHPLRKPLEVMIKSELPSVPAEIESQSLQAHLVTEYLHSISDAGRVSEVHGDALQDFLDWLCQYGLLSDSTRTQEKPSGSK